MEVGYESLGLLGGKDSSVFAEAIVLVEEN